MLFATIPVLIAGILLSDPLPIGSVLPHADKKMKDISGQEVSFRDAIRENGLLVMFSCNTCPIVKKYESRTMASAKAAIDQNIGVILLNPNEAYRDKGDSYDDMKKYAGNLSYNFHYVVDENAFMADVFGATRTPECFLFNKEGKLVYHGAIDDNPNSASQARPYLVTAMENMVQGKAISPENTRSIGCTIKRKN